MADKSNTVRECIGCTHALLEAGFSLGGSGIGILRLRRSRGITVPVVNQCLQLKGLILGADGYGLLLRWCRPVAGPVRA